MLSERHWKISRISAANQNQVYISSTTAGLSITPKRKNHMAYLKRFLCIILLTCSVFGAPISSSDGSSPDSNYQDESDAQEATPSKGVSLSSFGHLGVNVGLGAAVLLGAIAAAEAAIHVIEGYKKSTAERKQMQFTRARQLAWQKDQLQREHEALEVLLNLADKQAQKISQAGFENKLKPFKVPKEIHQSLERIFKKKDGKDGTGETFYNLKEALAPLLEFEE